MYEQSLYSDGGERFVWHLKCNWTCLFQNKAQNIRSILNSVYIAKKTFRNFDIVKTLQYLISQMFFVTKFLSSRNICFSLLDHAHRWLTVLSIITFLNPLIYNVFCPQAN